MRQLAQTARRNLHVIVDVVVGLVQEPRPYAGHVAGPPFATPLRDDIGLW